jgi:hypothetical protein
MPNCYNVVNSMGEGSVILVQQAIFTFALRAFDNKMT